MIARGVMMARPRARIVLLPLIAWMCALPAPAEALQIQTVSVSRATFSPSKQEKVEIAYTIDKAAAITTKVWDPDFHLVRTLVSGRTRQPGRHRDAWDGRDSDGRVVPNEAYFFTIEASSPSGETAVYQPVTFSGGEVGEITGGQVSRRTGTISYRLSQPSRVLLRAGIAGHAMLKTIVDWAPRAEGAVTEYWNGKDEDNVIDILARKYTMILSYTTLPANSVITFGNDTYGYRDYVASVKLPRPRKADRPVVNSRQISPHFWKRRTEDRAFRVKLSFPEAGGGPDDGTRVVPARDRVLLRIDVDPADKAVLQDQQFEIIVFVDTVFHLEEERGYLPFNVPIEIKNLPAGEHVVTVNLITFGDQIGVGSRKIQVTR